MCCQRWLGNAQVEIEPLYGPLVLWALQHWQKPDERLHLALDTTMLWNHYCVVVLSAVCRSRAVPLLWTTLEHASASVSAEVCLTLLDRADQLLAEFGAITLLADRALSSAELMGCELRRLRLPRGYCRGFRDVQLWGDGSQKANLLLAHPSGIAIDEPWYLVSNAGQRWIWSGATPDASAVSSCSATRNQASSSWRAAVCATRSGSIGCCCWWSPLPCW